MRHDLIALSKFLSLVLRHHPDRIGLSLSPEGWVEVETLLAAAAGAGHGIDREVLEEVVRSNDKRRFCFSDDGLRIRANQGHSVAVDLQLETLPPPERLYHGTAQRFLPLIGREGLHRMQRHHVHLSADAASARQVGARHGKPVVLVVDSARMAAEGHRFHRSANGVWLTDAVPARYLQELPA